MNGYQIMENAKGWVVFTGEGVAAGPFSSYAEAEQDAERRAPERKRP